MRYDTNDQKLLPDQPISGQRPMLLSTCMYVLESMEGAAYSLVSDPNKLVRVVGQKERSLLYTIKLRQADMGKCGSSGSLGPNGTECLFCHIRDPIIS